MAIGWVAARSACQLSPTRAKTLSSSISFLVASIDLFGLVPVVDALEFELPALHTAGLVYFSECRFETRFHTLAQSRGRTFERSCLTKTTSSAETPSSANAGPAAARRATNTTGSARSGEARI